MQNFVGLDIGGTKIAGAVFSESSQPIRTIKRLTPSNYEDFISACVEVVDELKQIASSFDCIGIGLPGLIDHKNGMVSAPNLTCLEQKSLREDLQQALKKRVRIANDANCAALAEAIDGAGAGYDSVFGLIMGTGVGGGMVWRGSVMNGANGMGGEIGHLPLPFRAPEDGVLQSCGCGQLGCIDKTVSGTGLSHLCEFMTGKKRDAIELVAMAESGEADALRVMDRFYEITAKAMVAILHTFDPEIIVVSGGLSDLPKLYEEVPKRWGKYAYMAEPKTKFVAAKHGSMAGLRGAAWLWR